MHHLLQVDLYSGDLNGSLTTEVQVDFNEIKVKSIHFREGMSPKSNAPPKKNVFDKWSRSRVRLFDSPFLAFAAFQKNKHFKVPKKTKRWDYTTKPTNKNAKSDLVPQPSAFINIARTDRTWCPWTVPLPLLWSVPVVRPAVLRGPKSGNKLAQGWLKVLIPRKNDVNKIDLGTNIHKFGLPINTFIKFVMDSKVMKKNTYWQSHSAIRLQCNEMRFDYHMFPFSNLVT